MRRLQVVLSLAIAVGCTGERPTELTWFVAASLGSAAHDAAHAYERERPQLRIRISAAGSQVLARQIEAGAPADVFTAASEPHAEAIAQHLFDRAILTCNEPVLVVATGSPVRSLRELPSAERVVLGAPEVPIGAYSEQILERAARVYRDPSFAVRVRARVVSRELDVRQVMSKVLLGEADAAIVYRTDALAADGIRTIELVDAPRARYPIAVVRSSPHAESARRFVDWLRGPAGREILHTHHFVDCDGPSGT